MVELRADTQKIVTGHVDIATVDLAPTIKAFPRQTGQMRGRWDWAGPAYPGTTPPIRAVRRRYLDESQRRHGAYEWKWFFDKWLFTQYEYFCDQFLPDEAESADVTVLHYDTYNNPMYLTAVIYRPDMEDGLSESFAGWSPTFTFRWGELLIP